MRDERRCSESVSNSCSASDTCKNNYQYDSYVLLLCTLFFDFACLDLSDISAQNYNGDTALHEAVRNVQTTIIDFLLKHEANSSILNESNMAPIHVAIDMNSLKSLDVST